MGIFLLSLCGLTVTCSYTVAIFPGTIHSFAELYTEKQALSTGGKGFTTNFFYLFMKSGRKESVFLCSDFDFYFQCLEKVFWNGFECSFIVGELPFPMHDHRVCTS